MSWEALRRWLNGRRLANMALSLPATVIWFPICGHFLFVFGSMAVVLYVRGAPPTAGVSFAAAELLVPVMSVGGLVGMAALWTSICFGDRVEAAGRRWRTALITGLWIGFLTSLLALAMGAGIWLRAGFNWFVHSLFLVLLGPMAVFLREVPSRRRKEPFPHGGQVVDP